MRERNFLDIDCPNLTCCMYSVDEGFRRGRKLGREEGIIDCLKLCWAIVVIAILIKSII